jgi:hypothetical protein
MIKIEISGTGEEVRREMLKLLGLGGAVTSSEPPAEKETAPEAEAQPPATKRRQTRRSRKEFVAPPSIWSEEEAETLLNRIGSNAKKFLIELANKPDGYKRSELVKVLGSNMQSLKGQLSSVGVALKKMANKPSPISRGKIDGEFAYKLDSVVAGVAKQRSL